MSEFEIDFVITPEMSAENHGNLGFPVLATPVLLGLFEKAAIAAMADRLVEGEGSVGTGASLQHVAATPIGQKVTIVVRSCSQDGKKLSFEMEARDEVEKIGSCEHGRFIVDVGRFRDRLDRKSAPETR